MRHATDPDHVIAVTTILSRESRLTAATRVGVVWGLGHTLTVLIAGAVIILFKVVIPTRLGLAMEFAVAVVLILLGFGAVARLMRGIVTRVSGDPNDMKGPVVDAHRHIHERTPHLHTHVATESIAYAPYRDHAHHTDSLPSFVSRRRLIRSFGVGLVHGLAGSAAIALLV